MAGRIDGPAEIIYRATSLIKNTHPPKITIGLQAKVYCKVLRGWCFLWARYPCTRATLRGSFVAGRIDGPAEIIYPTPKGDAFVTHAHFAQARLSPV